MCIIDLELSVFPREDALLRATSRHLVPSEEGDGCDGYVDSPSNLSYISRCPFACFPNLPRGL